jgi:NitT/TauT family transport system permease protein
MMANAANTLSAGTDAASLGHAENKGQSKTVGAAHGRSVVFVRKSALPILGLTTFFVGWHALASWMAKPLLLPGPLDVIVAYQQLIADGTLKADTLSSLKRVFTGFSIAAVIGVPLALILSVSTSLRYFAMPVLSVIRPIPPIAWIPLAILWFGIGDAPSFFITAIASFFPVFLNSLSGGCSVNENHVQAARCLGATSLSVVRHVVLPSAAPHVWTGLKIGLGQAWMAVVTAELIAAHSGLGYMIQVNRLNLETPAVLAGMLTIGILGALMAFSLSALERHLLPWRIQK